MQYNKMIEVDPTGDARITKTTNANEIVGVIEVEFPPTQGTLSTTPKPAPPAVSQDVDLAGYKMLQSEVRYGFTGHGASNLNIGAISLVEVTRPRHRRLLFACSFGLMPVGVQTSRNATSQTAATNIIACGCGRFPCHPENESD